ncbi:hypothetical protein GGS24DRAFT_514803 [Hypoxylon argillaceum]|nr:hypothetical protein GGS24DRAFT_514803 [Hypoxylon argillaceum]
MQSPTTVACVAFAFLVVIALVGVCHIFKIYYFAVASFILFFYFAIGTILLSLTTTNERTWAEWSWRWSVVGALLDSLCAIKSTKEGRQFQNAVYFQVIIVLVETVGVIVSPAIPSPTISKYLTFGIVIEHSLWTSASALYWTSSRKRLVRLVASIGQGLAAVTLIWSQIGFVIASISSPLQSYLFGLLRQLFCLSSILIYVEELGDSRQGFGRLGSSHHRTNPGSIESGLAAEIRPKYNVVFFGKGAERTDLLRRVLNWPPVSPEFGGVSLYDHPTRKDAALASVSPNISLHAKDKETYIRALIKSAAAIVLIYDPSNYASLAYIKSLRGFPEGQPVLLVSCNGLNEASVVSEEDAQVFASQHGWKFSTANEIEVAFNDLLDNMFARPRLRSNYSNAPQQHFAV